MLLVENVLHEFLNDFLNKRNLPFPDGRMLYAYQMNQREYLELKEKLNELCQNEELVDLLRNKDFSRCFVLYASEWWKREYSGGVWSWEPIFKTISNDEIKTHQVQVRSRAITEALEYWKYRNSLATGKKFLGAIIANGGLPSKFMQSDKYSSIVRVLRGILRFAGENNANDNELFMRTKEAVKKLPEAIRKDEICELIANLVSTIIKLKRDYELEKETHPVQILNQRCPSWKEQFPLLMEDASVEKMLVGFVEEASRINRNNVRGKIPSVDRIFDFSESDQLKFLFTFPEFDVSAAYFSKFFEISNAEELPQTFYINNLDLKNTTVAIVTMQLGSRKKYKIKKFDNRLDNVLNSVTISLSSADNKIHSKLVTISEKLDINAPFVFIKNDDDTLILKSNGSTYLRENECYIAYNSLVVSSGTGSGKTECFMIPIISDLVQQVEKTNSVLEGVQALFIYPLNALIQNQRERFSEWTKPYKGNIRYCLYNGLLPQQTRESEQKETVEEVVDREQLWKSPSPLLITNTTMLEYMLIRANDKRIIDKSKGKLKYIVLDEAHTYIGSQAAELSLLLKRVMDAFEVKPEQVKFIATSATIGDNDASTQLRRFLSSISGVNEENVTVVFGKNEIEPLASSTAGKSIDEIEKIENPDEIIKELRNNKLACSLRSFFISSNTEHGVARTLTEICNNFNLTSDLALRWLDLLSVTPVNEKSFLPLRLHIFHKTFPGLWSCCNPNCTCKDNIPGWKFGKIYFKEQCKCECGAPVFRVKACANCGEPFLEAKINDSAKDGKKYLYPTMLQDIDEFSLDDDDNYINDVEAHTVWVENFEKDNDTACYLNIEDSSLSLANSNGIRLNVFEDYEDIHCCDAPEVDQIKSFIPLQGAPFVLSHVLPTLLNYAEIAKDSESKPHAGQKMICFTDSRQGTARLAVQLQQNSERNSFRSILLHVIAHIEAENNKNNNADQINTLKEAYKSTKMPQLLDMIKQLEGQKGSSFANENNVITATSELQNIRLNKRTAL